MFLPGYSRKCAVGGYYSCTRHRLREGFHQGVVTPAKIREFSLVAIHQHTYSAHPCQVLTLLVLPMGRTYHGYPMGSTNHGTPMLPTPTAVVYSSAQVLRRLVTEAPLTTSRNATTWVDSHQIPA